MTTATFPRVKSAGVQGAKVVGREQLVKISAIHVRQPSTKGGAAGERSQNRSKGTHEITVHKR